MVILLAEDDTSVRTLAALILKEEHFCVLQACNGEEALHLLHTDNEVDLLLTDIEMGDGINGLELRSRVLTELPGLPILVMSGFADNKSIAETRDIPFLAKPFTIASLTQRIREMLVSRIDPKAERRTLRMRR